MTAIDARAPIGVATYPEITAPSLRATAGATLGMLIGPTAIIAPPIGLFMPAVSQEFGLGRAGFPLLMLMVSVFAGLGSPFAGRLIDRYGVRAVVLPGVFLFGLAEGALALTAGSLTALIAGMAVVGILAGIQNPTAYTKLLALWFERRRGRMVAIAGAIGGGGGGVLIPQIAERLIAVGGWRLGYAGLGAFILLGFPLLYLLLREPAGTVRRTKSVAHAAPCEGLTRGEAMRTAPFWMILVSLVGVSCSLVALSVHVPAWITDAGGSSALAAGFLSLFALGSVGGQFLSGILFDKINSPKVGAVFFAAAFLGALALRMTAPGSNLILLEAVLIGTALGAELGMACYFLSRFFGLRAYGEIYGTVYGTLVVASGLGPVLMGIAYENAGTYLPAFTVATATLAASAILILLLPRYVFAVAPSQQSEI